MKHEHEWRYWAGLDRGEWETCQECGAGRDYTTKEPILMTLVTATAEDGRPDIQLWIPVKSVTESGS